jgi:hypothetical protein
MVSWMSDREGRTMMDSGMWADPAQLRASCRQWTDTGRNRVGGSAGSTCDDMVAWMDEHSVGGAGSEWGTWRMHDR